MLKLVLLPPVDQERRVWAERMGQELPEYQIVLAETDEEMAHQIRDADAAYGWVPPHVLPLAQRLRWLQNPNVGPHVGYYYPALVSHPVVVTNPRGIFDDHIAQHILMYMLALARGLPDYLDAQRQRRWDKDARRSPYVDLAQSTALIAGVGSIGHEAARLCHAFGMRVIGVDPRWEHEVPFVEKHGPEELDALLPQADFVVVCLPHTPATEGMWNARRFRLMKPSAYFINIGRGLTTRIEDLTVAVEQGEIAGCALDVFEVEPFPTDHRLWSLPNVILTPHIAVKDARNLAERQFQIVLDNARRFAAGEPLRNVVDKANWF